MSTPDQRARDKDRDAAIEVVEAAWADGQIVEADRDHRVEALLRAQTLAEVKMIIHDLQVPGVPVAVPPPATVTAPAPEAHPYARPSPYGPPPSASTTATATAVKKGAGCVGVAVLVLVIAVFAIVGVVIAAVSSGVDDAIGTEVLEQPLPGVEVDKGVNVLSERGYRQLVEDVEAATGSTEAFEGVLYPSYAVVYLPVDAQSQRYSYWYWDGAMDDLESRGTSSYSRFDLGDVDISVVVRLVKRVRGLVEEPTSFYAIVRAPDAEEAAIWAYASNEYHESAFISATADGRVLYKSSP